MTGPNPARPTWWVLLGVFCNTGLVVTVFLPWRFERVLTASPGANHLSAPLTLAATRQGFDAVHRVLAAQSVARAILEVGVLVGALAGGALGLHPWLTGRTAPSRYLVATAVTTFAAATGALWVVPAFQPVTRLTVRVEAVSAPAAYAAFGLALVAAATSVVVARHHHDSQGDSQAP